MLYFVSIGQHMLFGLRERAQKRLNAIDPDTGDTSEFARNIIEACAGYTEYSPSRKRVHLNIIVEGGSDTYKSNEIELAVFCSRQFFLAARSCVSRHAARGLRDRC